MSAETHAFDRFKAALADDGFRARLAFAINQVPGNDRVTADDLDEGLQDDGVADWLTDLVTIVDGSTPVGEATPHERTVLAIHKDGAEHDFVLATITVVSQ